MELKNFGPWAASHISITLFAIYMSTYIISTTATHHFYTTYTYLLLYCNTYGTLTIITPSYF